MKRSLLQNTVLASILLALATIVASSGVLSSVDAATPSASARIIKGLKKQIATLKKQLAAARATPAAFVEMVKVGDAGNSGYSTSGGQAGARFSYGGVPYEFNIGKYEVTLAQYTAFLNAVASDDTYNLYSTNMMTRLSIAGIQRNGVGGSFTYSVMGNGSRPVTFVSWFDAARFCNWLHNGRPAGSQTASTTENGAYPLSGATSGGLQITRNPGARFWIPSGDEWDKAGYYDPALEGVRPAPFWTYPTMSDAEPGNTISPLPNRANFLKVVYSVTQSGGFDSDQNYLTPVGTYTGSRSFYGTFDQGGSVWEWTDYVFETFRLKQGGSWNSSSADLRITHSYETPDTEANNIGFRVASP